MSAFVERMLSSRGFSGARGSDVCDRTDHHDDARTGPIQGHPGTGFGDGAGREGVSWTYEGITLPSRDHGEAGFGVWAVGQVATTQAGEDHIRNNRAPGRSVCSMVVRFADGLRSNTTTDRAVRRYWRSRSTVHPGVLGPRLLASEQPVAGRAGGVVAPANPVSNAETIVRSAPVDRST